MSKVIKITDLGFRYRNTTEFAIDNISLEVEPGELVVIMGHGGAGKSSFCFCLNRIIPCILQGELKGSIILQGESIEKSQPHDLTGQVGIVFQDFEVQLISVSVAQEVAFPLENLGIERSEMLKRIKESLEKVDLVGYDDRTPTTLSGGQKQRLAIASVLATHPRLLILDEPTTDLDPLGKSHIFEIASRLKGHQTIIIVEHETEKIIGADRLIIFHQGKLHAQGKPRRLLADTRMLVDCGIKPLEVIEIAELLGLDASPITVDECCRKLKAGNVSLDMEKFKELRAKERQVIDNYGEEVINISNLSYRYQDTSQPALNGIDLTVRRGEFIAILGQNGSGKTTLAKLMNGLLRPEADRVMVMGEDASTAGLRRLCQHVGYVFQNPDHQLFARTVWEEVSFAPRMFGQDEKQIEESVKLALVSVKMLEYKDKDPLSLPKGMRQRVAVASILASQPEIIILDEPTTGLDYNQLNSMMELISSQNHCGRTIIMITHSVWVAARWAHRILIMNQGRIIADGSPRDILADFELLKETSLEAPDSVLVSQGLFKETLLSPVEFKMVCRVES